MNRVLISGYYGFGNAGDEAMLSAIVEVLRSRNEKIEIVVISGDPEATASVYNIKAIRRFDATAIIKEMRKSDLVISGGGSLLQDITSERSLWYYLSIIQLAKILRKKIMLYGQGIGPINGKFARVLTGFVCRQVDCITVRDQGSAKELQSLGIQSKSVVVTADPVFAIQPTDKDRGRKKLERNGFGGKKLIVGISVRPWQCLTGYKQVLAEVADSIIEKHGSSVVFIPLHHPQDTKVSKEIFALMKNKESCIVLENMRSTNDFLSIIGNMDLLIGVRLHALVFAAVMNVPILGISYDPKIDRFLEGIQAKPVACMRTVTYSVLMEKVDSVIENLERERDIQGECVEQLKEAAQNNADLAIELLKNIK